MQHAFSRRWKVALAGIVVVVTTALLGMGSIAMAHGRHGQRTQVVAQPLGTTKGQRQGPRLEHHQGDVGLDARQRGQTRQPLHAVERHGMTVKITNYGGIVQSICGA